MDPQWVNMWEAIREFFQQNTCTIFLEFDGWLEPQGSGTIIRIGEKTFVATAAHVVMDFPMSKIFIGASRLNGRYFKIIDWKIEGGEEFENHDEAWIQVEFPPNSDLSGLIGPENISTYEQKIDEYFVSGFPEKLKQPIVVGKLNRMNMTMFNYLTGPIPEKDWPKEFLPGHDIVLEFTPVFSEASGDQRAAPLPKGISGGGIWKVDSTKSNIWSTARLRLVGIQTGANIKTELIYGRPLTFWIRMVKRDHPDLNEI